MRGEFIAPQPQRPVDIVRDHRIAQRKVRSLQPPDPAAFKPTRIWKPGFRKVEQTQTYLTYQKREKAFAQWRWILEVAGPENSSLAHELTCKFATDEAGRKQRILNAFAISSAGTLFKRASALGKYAKWCEQRTTAPFPSTHDKIFDFFEEERSLGAPASRAMFFHQAGHLATEIVRFYSFIHIFDSTAIKGLDRRPVTTKE